MDKNRWAGRWKQVRGTARLYWGRLIHDTALARAGERERLVGRLQGAYGAAKDQAGRRARAWRLRVP